MSTSPIKTPDQKLRVFISSTINELAEERRIAREAITRLTLTPVLFEMGARPYAPRDLYKAYLDQSHIFIGIYWKSYGWIAPDMEISGLEDEYRLSRNKPSLIYIKRTTEPRDPALEKLIREMESTGSVSYQKFSTPDELSEFLLNDLAVLLSESFENQNANRQITNSLKSHLPVIRLNLIGREEELKSLSELLQKQSGLVTITGPGGTGKTSLALKAGKNMESKFRDGVHLIEFASVTDPELIPATIARTIGLFDSGKQAIAETLIENLRDKNALLIFDNLEQLLKDTKFIVDILDHCPSVTILATSRAPLHLRYEQVFPLLPLQIPQPGKKITLEEAIAFPSVKLFIDLAQKLNPSLPLNEENVNAIIAICEKLDGLPLAIELAAARSRLFSPQQLLDRMGNTLNLLNQGSRDLPARQQTLYAAIDWSYNLLDRDVQVYFRRLSVFSNGWTTSAANAVCTTKNDTDAMNFTEQLSDFGLIRLQINSGDPVSEPRFEMLQTVKEFASMKLQESSGKVQIDDNHLTYYCQYVTGLSPKVWTSDAAPWLDEFEIDHQNISQAFNYAVDKKDNASTWMIIAALGPLWIYRGHISEAVDWIGRSGMTIPMVIEKANSGEVNFHTCGVALLSTGAMYYYAGKYPLAIDYLKASTSLLEKTDDTDKLAWSILYTGLTGLSLGDFNAVALIKEGIRIGKESNDMLCYISSQAFYTEVLMAQDLLTEALKLIDEVEAFAERKGGGMGIAIAQFQKSNLLYYTGDFEKAGEGFERTIQLFIKMNFHSTMGWAFISYGNCLMMLHRYEESLEKLRMGLTLGRESGDKGMIILALTAIAANFAGQGQKAKAIQIMQAVDDLSDIYPGFNGWSANRKSVEHIHQIFNDANILNDIMNKSGKIISLDEAIAIAFS
ncbi:MAG: DUF4062 domain-containing protein [Saprospiraceae bacterium]